MWRAEGKWLPKTSRKSVSQSVFCGTSTYCVLNTVPPIEDDHGNSNSSHVKIFLPKKLLECLPKCSSLPKERHRWNTNEEIAAYLITFEKHEEWLTTSPKTSNEKATGRWTPENSPRRISSWVSSVWICKQKTLWTASSAVCQTQPWVPQN
uniref:calmodulin-binding transcription activator 1 isoform X30 n=1 Tax=Callithrix jacchus TaxID=9483 RepID=UPI0023DD35EA|nr:calmodulin-binding transcription activator 1 isoform X30 [Callithrix jacchus]